LSSIKPEQFHITATMVI